MTREQVGWVRFDGDEYHDFRYASPDDKRGTAMSIAADFLPVYVDVAEPEPKRCTHTFPLPSWMGPDQADPCRCDLPNAHDGAHECEHIRAKATT